MKICKYDSDWGLSSVTGPATPETREKQAESWVLDLLLGVGSMLPYVNDIDDRLEKKNVWFMKEIPHHHKNWT